MGSLERACATAFLRRRGYEKASTVFLFGSASIYDVRKGGSEAPFRTAAHFAWAQSYRRHNYWLLQSLQAAVISHPPNCVLASKQANRARFFAETAAWAYLSLSRGQVHIQRDRVIKIPPGFLSRVVIQKSMATWQQNCGLPPWAAALSLLPVAQG